MPVEGYEANSPVGAFLAENPFAAEANQLLQKAIEQRSEWILRRAETYATLAVAFEQRLSRFDISVELQNHAQQTRGF